MAAEPDAPSNQNVAGKGTPKPPLRASPLPGQVLGIALAGTGVLLGVQSVLMGLFAGESVWKTSWVIGAVCMGPVVVHWPALFDLSAITAAMTALYPTALVCGVVLCGVTFRLSLKGAILAGGLAGAFFYAVDLYGLARLFPWLAVEHNWMALLSYVVFGGLMAWRLRRASEVLP